MEHILAFDYAILDFFQGLHCTVLDAVMVFFTTIGNNGLLWIFLGLGLLIFKETRKVGIVVLVALLATYLCNDLILKNLVQRERPCNAIGAIYKHLVDAPSSYSFPSGHSASSFTASVAIYFSLDKKRRICGVLALIVAFLIAVSRAYVYVHFPTDIIVGSILGGAIGFTSAKLLGHLFTKRSELK